MRNTKGIRRMPLGGGERGGHSNVPALHLGLQCTLKALTRPLNFFPLHWKAAALFQKSKLVNTRTPFLEPREFPPIPFQTPPNSKKSLAATGGGGGDTPLPRRGGRGVRLGNGTGRSSENPLLCWAPGEKVSGEEGGERNIQERKIK